jgi:DNA-binding IclR family transcriptional regulator
MSDADDLSPAEGRRYSAPALEKGLDILEALSLEGRPLSMTDIATRLGRSKSEIFRNLWILAERGYIARDPGDDRYSLTTRMFEMCMRGTPSATLVGAAYPVMSALTREVEQSVHLAVISRDQMVVVARVESPGEVCFSVPVGHRNMLPFSVSGRILLAFQSEASRERLLGVLRARLATDRFDERALRDRIAEIRSRGREIAESGTVNGVTDIGFPIFDAHGEVLASLTMPFTSRRSRSDQVEMVAEKMAEAARQVNAILGASAARR